MKFNGDISPDSFGEVTLSNYLRLRFTIVNGAVFVSDKRSSLPDNSTLVGFLFKILLVFI